MNLLDILGGGDPAQAYAPEVPAQVADQPPAGGLGGALGLDRASVAMALRSLAGGLQGVKNSPFGGEVFAQGLGGALAGGNKYEDEQQKLAINQAELDRRHQLEQAKLGETSRYHTGLLDRGKFQFLAGTGKDEEGKDVPGMHVVDVLTGETKFRPGAVITGGRGGGAAGRDPAKLQMIRWLRSGENPIAKTDEEAWNMVNQAVVNPNETYRKVYQALLKEYGNAARAKREADEFMKTLPGAAPKAPAAPPAAAPAAPAPVAPPTPMPALPPDKSAAGIILDRLRGGTAPPSPDPLIGKPLPGRPDETIIGVDAGPAAAPPAAAPPAPRNAAERVVGQVYTSPSGQRGRWTGTGWEVVP